MKFKYLAIATILCLLVFNLKAQIIATIGGDEITTEDFIAIYEKNNNPDYALEVLPKEEYLQLFINFKLKVKEAESLGMDQKASFKKEYNKYRDQLIKPYLMDSLAYENMIKESYENMKYDIRASHILIELPETEISSDTIFAWNKAIDIRNQFLNGKDFGDLAYKYSDDPSARESRYEGIVYPGNKGDLGYFTAFDMVYPFEHAAYLLNVGEVSMPIRSRFGYHLIYLTDKFPALGECIVSHLLLMVPPNSSSADSASIMKKANDIYKRMMKGENFEKLVAEYSDDKSTSKEKGRLLPFTTNKIEANFIKNISTLQPGDISKPFFTPYGCHIVRLESRSKLGTLEEERNYIKKRIANTDRVNYQDNVLYSELRSKFNYKLNGDNYKELLQLIEDHFGNLSVITLENNKELFTYAGKSVNQADFIKYITIREANKKTTFSESGILKYLNAYSNDLLLAEESKMLAKVNNEFRLLIQEYHDGILLFNINEEYVWNKSINDSIGLMNYYETNKDKYQWKERYRVNIYNISDKSIAKDVKKAILNDIPDDELTKKFVSKTHVRQVNVEKRYCEPGDNYYVDKAKKKIGLSKIMYDNNSAYIVKIREILPPRTKTFEECKGLVISDYQTYLEEKWVEKLKEKYPVVINVTELEKIK